MANIILELPVRVSVPVPELSANSSFPLPNRACGDLSGHCRRSTSYSLCQGGKITIRCRQQRIVCSLGAARLRIRPVILHQNNHKSGNTLVPQPHGASSAAGPASRLENLKITLNSTSRKARTSPRLAFTTEHRYKSRSVFTLFLPANYFRHAIRSIPFINMKLLITLSCLLCSILLASAQPHSKLHPTPAVFDDEKPMHTTELMAGAAMMTSQRVITTTRIPGAMTRPTQPAEQQEL